MSKSAKKTQAAIVDVKPPKRPKPQKGEKNYFASIIIVFLIISLLSGFFIGSKGKQSTKKDILESNITGQTSTVPLSSPIEGLSAPKPSKFDFCAPLKLVEVADGDTLQITSLSKKDFKRIRLIGIDTPEMGQKPFGEQAKNYLQQILKTSNEQKVCCKQGDDPTDKYGRTLAYCWAGDKFLNAAMVEGGQAVAFFVGEKNNQYKNLFVSLEEQAQEQELGIYDAKQPLDELPVEWRKNHKRKV